ncbi:MAG: aldehyde ferredoxin oxidoreductase family protein [Deltaproteobacteria bacterium]|nr:aldehyde ferredoxin oxidoreductase family protein [Deltaproteobacteria bacterium]MBW1854559.1 aldehyde ferredoxin oxidoreductase family protein [Deltaproteobacteria bacterium]MBW2182352.1 aldehyde ferredoxin oxidoreductase family protein [Deltaproteobacteria bacterium]
MSSDFRYKGYTGKLLRVNLTSGKVKEEPLKEEWAEKYLGGAGIASRILYDELKPGIDPLGPKNKTLIMTGPVNGTIIPTASRVGAYCKSPLTGSFFHGTAGGHIGAELKYAGWDGIIIEGRASVPVYLWIDDDLVEIREASHLWGMHSYEVQEKLKEELGLDEVHVASIGPAGELLNRFACITFGARVTGRGGTGAVWGSKKLKAVAVRGTGSVDVPDITKFKHFADELLKVFRNHPATSKILPTYGTPVLVNANNALGIFGSYNWQEELFENAEGLSGETMRETIVAKDKACFACPVRSSKLCVIKSERDGNYVVEGPEYENIYSLGSCCGIGSIKTVAIAERICDNYGMDAIEAGVAIAFSMECFEKGILTLEDTEGMELRFGDEEAMLTMLHKIGKREGLGDLLAEGVKRVSEKLGHGSEDFAMHTKGMTVAGHSARGMPGFGLGYATGPRGGSHHDGRPTGERTGLVLRETFEGKAEYTARINHFSIYTDSMIVCHLAESIWGPLDISEWCVKSLNVATGMQSSLEDAKKTAERIWNMMRAFMVREGFRRKDDKLPKRFMEEPIPKGPSKGMVFSRENLDKLLDEYYGFRGWDLKTGIPTPERLTSLDLEDVAQDMKPYLAATGQPEE